MSDSRKPGRDVPKGPAADPYRAITRRGAQGRSSPPLFCVIMPAFEAAATVGEAIDSVLAQSYTDWELVVVDDGSTDATFAEAQRHAGGDARATVLRRPHAGTAAARDACARAGTAPLLLRLDADDVLMPHCLQTYADFTAAHEGFDIYSCTGEVFAPSGAAQPYYSGEGARSVAHFSLELMLDANYILGAAAVFTRSLFERVGGMREGVYVEDYDFWLRALAAGARHVYVPEVLVRYRFHPGQMTRDTASIQASIAEVMEHLADSGSLDDRLAARARSAAARARATLSSDGHAGVPGGIDAG